MILTLATVADVPRLVRFRADAAAWLSGVGSDQWSTSFPTDQIIRSVENGEVYLLREADLTDPVATITLDTETDPLLWTEPELSEPAMYVHKLTVDPSHRGRQLGGFLLDWAGDRAARLGAEWLRLDAWTSNARLQQYYLEAGFSHVRTALDPELGGSGWAAQRPTYLADVAFEDRSPPGKQLTPLRLYPDSSPTDTNC